MVLERAAAALALHRMIERDRSGLHQQAQSGLIDDVLQGRITDEREAAARAHALGLRKATRYFPVVVRVDRQFGSVGSCCSATAQRQPYRCCRAHRECRGPQRFVLDSPGRRDRRAVGAQHRARRRG